MKAWRITVVAALLIFGFFGILFCLGPFGPYSPYKRFMDKDATYYKQVAQACDSILRQHPKGSKGLQRDAILVDSFDLSTKDLSIPATIHALHPDRIILSSNHVYVGFGVGRLSWGIIWEQDDERTNSWTLSTNADGLNKTLYTEQRH
jgi:hypothetical protein